MQLCDILVPANGFSDVSRSAWYAEAVDSVKAGGLMNGVGNNRFDPDGTVTRAMVITVLYSLADEPSVKGQSNPFRDVPNGADCRYSNAGIRAVRNGDAAGTFRPQSTLSRAECAQTFLNLYAI